MQHISIILSTDGAAYTVPGYMLHAQFFVRRNQRCRL